MKATNLFVTLMVFAINAFADDGPRKTSKTRKRLASTGYSVMFFSLRAFSVLRGSNSRTRRSALRLADELRVAPPEPHG